MDPRDIGICASLACVLEVSAPKPGNVDRFHDFDDTRYEDFLASGVALGAVCKDAATRGMEAGRGRLGIDGVGLGGLIRDGVACTRRWHSGKNTNLGMAMLLVPISAGAGYAMARDGRIENARLQEVTAGLIKESTWKDTTALYEAITMAGAGGLGKRQELDVNNAKSIDMIKKEKINMYEVMKKAENDSIAMEFTNNYQISFEIGYEAIISKYRQTWDLKDSILFAHMAILARVPDTLIARKCGTGKAAEVSREAAAVLEGGMEPRMMDDLDAYLRSRGNLLNPGTTADLTCSSLMIALLNGVRP